MSFYCKICDYNTSRKYDFNKHIKTKKHVENFGHICYNQANEMIIAPENNEYIKIDGKPSLATFSKSGDFKNNMISNVNKKNEKMSLDAYGFATFEEKSRKTDTDDTKNMMKDYCHDISLQPITKKEKYKKKEEIYKLKHVNETFICEICMKKYKTRSGLRKHKLNKHENNDIKLDSYHDNKKTENVINMDIEIENNNNHENKQLTKLIEVLLNENKNLQHKMIELASKPTVIHQTNNTKTFNIINYLNHDCKDAMNLSDFIRSLVITFEDLENIETHGFLKSVKHTLIDGLNAMEQNKRPIHCTDTKRKQFYIKNEDVWNKDTNHIMIHKAITDFNHNQLIKFSEWKKVNPNWLNDDKQQDKVNKITKELTCIYSDDNDKMKHKLINDIVDVTIIQKDED